jgi:hypothetical protein
VKLGDQHRSLCLIIAGYVANREGAYHLERLFTGLLVVSMAITVFYGVMKLRQMQTAYDATFRRRPRNRDPIAVALFDGADSGIPAPLT